MSLLLTLLLASVLAVPAKNCQLVRSSTQQGQCFSEPECQDVCQTVQEKQCSTTTEQVRLTITIQLELITHH